MKYVIFYSWQSDLPNNTNRGFIESVIKDTIREIKKNDDFDLEPSLDKDTLGVPGAPNISQALLDKIKSCDAFVADISIVITGAKRSSPNPNVLLELGYAIALLGWPKIILFYNTAHGKDEDIPFDIKQHRRIPYNLAEEDQKPIIKKQLISQFRGRLIELLHHGKESYNHKYPSISACWNFWDSYSSANIEKDDGYISPIIDIASIPDTSNIIEELQKEIIEVEISDGNIDPSWSKKVEDFKNKSNKLIEFLSKKDNFIEYLFDQNIGKATIATLCVKNDGNVFASDIRVEIKLPDWLIIFDTIPKTENIPSRPLKPEPTAPRMKTLSISLPHFSPFQISQIHHPIFTPPKLSECYIKNGKGICFRADQLLHKHEILNRGDKLYILAKSDAPIGENVLHGRIFCSEYDDWKDMTITINVI
ncbi:MAG TPA: hypothetical protein VIF37_08905 [Methylobacter sp.]|jgi:hypothetical protein